MTNPIRIRRRASGGATGAPTSLLNAEIAYNESDLGNGILYYGYGTGGVGGTATSIVAIGGGGAFVSLTGNQTTAGSLAISGNKDFTGTVSFGANTSGVTATSSDNSTKLATTAFVKSQNYLTSSNAVTSVALSLPNIFTVSGSPVTTTGTLTGSLASQSANTVFAAPNGTTGTPTFRSLVATDIPTITAAKVSDFDTQVRTNRLDQMSAPTASVGFNNQKISNLATCVDANDAANKAYVDNAVSGLTWKDSANLLATTNIALTGTDGTLVIDGHSALDITDVGYRLLLTGQNTASDNGIYEYTVSSGTYTLVRATDANTYQELIGAAIFIKEGTAYANTGWLQSNHYLTSFSGQVWVQFSGAGSYTAGSGLTSTGTTFNVGTASASRIVVNADNIDLATTGVSAGTYKSVTVDLYGRITGGTNPTTLSGYGITDAQALDATLTALAGVTTAANQLIYATGADTFTVTGLTAFGRSLIDDADATAGRATLGLTIGTNIQAWDADLDTLSGMQVGAASALALLTSSEIAILDGALVTTSELNTIDGSTSATATTLTLADRIVVNDNGVMKQVALSDLVAFLEDNTASGFDIDAGTF